MKNKINFIIAVSVLVFIAMACNASFTTANISSFNFGKNEAANPPTTNFNVGEKVFAVANVANAMGKHKMKFKITPAGGSPVDKEVDFEGSVPITYSYTPTTSGEVKFEVSLLDESGKEIDKKSGSITIKGDATKTSTDDSSKSDSDSDSNSDSEKKSDDK